MPVKIPPVRCFLKSMQSMGGEAGFSGTVRVTHTRGQSPDAEK